MKRLLTTLALLSILVMIMGVYAATQSSANTPTNQASLDTPMTTTVTNGPIKSVTAITEVFGEGQKVTAVAVEYDQDIDNAKLSPSTFTVEGRTITQVYANTAPAKAAPGINGKYVLIELSTDDANASTLAHSGTGPASRTIRSAVKLSVTQVGEITTTTGETYAATSQAVVSDKEINLVVDDFQQLEYKDPKTGITLKYNLYVPKNYDQNKSYPLVLFIHDAGTVSDDPKITLVQGLGAVVWATPSEQAKHESFVLAPQFASPTVNDQSEATPELDVTVDLINALTGQYNIDKSRIYTTGQSMGCMSSIALLIKYPDLFAAAMLVAGQWDATKVAPLAQDKLWIIVSEGDLKAFPGMNEITAALEQEGAKVSRATWSGLSSPAEFAAEVDKMMAEGNPIKYVALQKGTVVPAGQTDDGGSNHINTWRIAYTIEGVRDWLFSQVKTPAYKDVAYAGASSAQKLDLYLPAGNGPFPVIINIHGGGFKFGDKGMVDYPLADTLLSSGYAIASLDYRLSGEAIFPAAVLDAKAAVRFLRANAAQYKLNPDKMVAFGQSAGGNIAAMLGTTGDVAEFDDSSLGNPDVSSRVQAVIDWFGPTDFGQMDAQAKAQRCSADDQKHNEAGSFESLYLGAAVPSVPELVQKANPITYLTPDDPPFLIQKGDQDCTVPIESTKMLADALTAAGLEVQYDLLNGVGHGDSREAGATPVFQSQENIQNVLNFLNTKLK